MTFSFNTRSISSQPNWDKLSFGFQPNVSITPENGGNTPDVTGNIITIDSNGTGLYLKPGTYTAIGTTMDWETGQEYTPSYTFAEDVHFTPDNETYRVYLTNETYGSISQERGVTTSVTQQGITKTLNQTATSSKPTSANSWDFAASNKENGAVTINYTITPESGSPCYSYETNITFNTSHHQASGTNVVSYKLQIIGSDGSVVEETQYGSTLTISGLTNGAKTYYPSFKVRALNQGEYIRLVETNTLTSWTMGSGTDFSIKVSSWNYNTYPAKTIRIGLESYSGRYTIREDYEGIWDLGYVHFEENNSKMISWSANE